MEAAKKALDSRVKISLCGKHMALVDSPEATAKVATDTKPADAKPAEAVPSQQSQEKDFTAEVANANDPRKVKELLNRMRTQAAPKTTDKPAEAAKPAEAKKESEGTEKVAAEAKTETPEAGTEKTEVAEEVAETPEGGEDESAEGDEDAKVTPLFGKRVHLRLPPEDDQVGRLALALMKRNKDMKLGDALAKANEQLGIKPEETEKAPAKEATPAKVDPLDTIEGITAEGEKLEAAYLKANEDLQFGEAAKISLQLRKLDKRRDDLVRKQEREASDRTSAESAKYDADFSKSEKRATELYDFAADPKTPGGQRMAEIDAALKAHGDELYYSPNKPLVIAQMVARELRIAPKGPSAKTPTTVKPAVSQQPKTEKPKSVIPDGGATTTPRTQNQEGKFTDTVNGVQTLAQLNKLRKELGLPH